jgi:hypothetical protein
MYFLVFSLCRFPSPSFDTFARTLPDLEIVVVELW